MAITRQDIEQDIVEYDRRLLRLRCRLQDMSRSRRRDRKKITDEIAHVQNLKRMAQDALNDGPVNKLASTGAKR